MVSRVKRDRDLVKRVAFIADLFKEHYLGGGESNDDVLIRHLMRNGFEVDKIQSHTATPDIIDSHSTFIIGNFLGLSEGSRKSLIGKEYIIYEHDHKYVTTRDPSKFGDFLIPEECIVNREFYEGAKAVVVLSKVCKEIIEKTMRLEHVYSIGCSLWTSEKLDLIESLTLTPKTKGHVLVQSTNPTKGYFQALEYCRKNNIPFGTISRCGEEELLEQLAEYRVLVFLPQVLETFCRLAVEAKMLNCKLLTRKKMLGFASEECFNLSGLELINDIRDRVNGAYRVFIELLNKG